MTANDRMAWTGLRPLRVARRVEEARDVTSLWLAADDGAALPSFQPGQYLTLDLDVPGQPRPAVACYSLSGPPDAPTYRITVKALAGGRGSPHLAGRVREGDLLRARAPAGRFVLDPHAADPAVLVGGGIGVAPFVSMLHAAATTGARDVFVVLGMRDGAEHPLRAEVAALCGASPRLRLHVAYSRPGPDDALGRDHDSSGRVSIDLLARVLPPAERPYAFYVCGPPAMTADVTAGLRGLGVPAGQVHVEAFGRATTRRLRPPATTAAEASVAAATRGPAVTFARAGKTVAWDPRLDALLSLAERAGAPIPYACGVGRCGTCLTRLLAGRVRYPFAPGYPAPPGTCLPCVAVPDGADPLTLDA